MSKELQNLDSIYVNLMTDVFNIVVKYRRKIIAIYRLVGTEIKELMINKIMFNS